MSWQRFSIFVLLVIAPTSVYSQSRDGQVLGPLQRPGPANHTFSFSQHQCWKEKYCKSNGKKVCAFNLKTGGVGVAYFDNQCAMHEANCNTRGKYILAPLEACVDKKMQDNEIGWKSYPRISAAAVTSNRAADMLLPYIMNGSRGLRKKVKQIKNGGRMETLKISNDF